jgi:hypothetical protein
MALWLLGTGFLLILKDQMMTKCLFGNVYFKYTFGTGCVIWNALLALFELAF